MPKAQFIAELPKVELHAHLNGSLNTESILELGEAIYGARTEEFADMTKKFISFEGLDGCFQKFKFMHELTATKKGLKLATEYAIRDFVADHVVYLELRTTPKSNENMTKQEYLQCVLEAIEVACLNLDIIVKLVPSIDRGRPVEEAIEMLNIVLQLRRLSPENEAIIAGIDLSGNPKLGVFKDFVPLLEKARQNGLKLTLHCAEIENPTEIAEMLSFGMERCGHGTFLRLPRIKELAQRKIAIECCLTSNVKCATVPSYSDHHFKHIFQFENAENEAGILVLCTDDCGVFDTTLTQELTLAKETFKLSEKDLMRLQLNAVMHAFTNETEKQTLRDKIMLYCNEKMK